MDTARNVGNRSQLIEHFPVAKGIGLAHELFLSKLIIESDCQVMIEENLKFFALCPSSKGWQWGAGGMKKTYLPTRAVNEFRPSGYSKTQTHTLIVKLGPRPGPIPSRYQFSGLRPDPLGSRTDGDGDGGGGDELKKMSKGRESERVRYAGGRVKLKSESESNRCSQ
ncbi:hypothetical protein M9H77_13770 [Catharanthus roseus]|uniref:Uncharacterized protein n=1 Tax=Catharanthus roseus TaxID=4058 RepID=A0ACC0BLE1_CATRO|nr:hypothetical protein M9H77_13770 [Catharanthus roseus]